VLCLFTSIKQRVCFSFHTILERFSRWIKPRTTSLLLGAFSDITRGKSELLAENALLRHQLVILRRQIKRPVYRKRDRLLLVLLTRMVRTWKQALFPVQPETLLRWHRELFRVFTEAQIEGAFEEAEAFVRDDQFNEGNGSKQPPSSELSVFVASCSSWIFVCLNERFKSI
jgi:hypothetical protein